MQPLEAATAVNHVDDGKKAVLVEVGGETIREGYMEEECRW